MVGMCRVWIQNFGLDILLFFVFLVLCGLGLEWFSSDLGIRYFRVGVGQSFRSYKQFLFLVECVVWRILSFCSLRKVLVSLWGEFVRVVFWESTEKAQVLLGKESQFIVFSCFFLIGLRLEDIFIFYFRILRVTRVVMTRRR